MAVFVGAFSRHPSPPDTTRAISLLGHLRRPPGSQASHWEQDGVSLAAATVLGESTVDSGDGLAVAADARLDDAAALRQVLRAPPSASGAALIRLAYQRWGRDCVHHLDGDFAFVVWDERDQSVFGARDRFGIRPLVYAEKDGGLWVGSQPRLMLAAGVDRQPDLWRVAETLLGTFADPESTAFEAIRRLPAGHRLMGHEGGLRTEAYWRPDPDLAEAREPLRETAARFRNAFDASVTRRMAVDPAFGAYLSGGLDSSSVVVTVRARHPEPFPVFTAIYPGLGRADERGYADLVADHVNLTPHYVDPLNLSPVAEHDADALGIDEPLYVATWPMEKALLEAARERDVRVMFSGHGGDHLLHASPLGVFGDWLRAGRWVRLAREARLGATSWHGAVRDIWLDGLKDLIRHQQPTTLRNARRLPVSTLLHPDLVAETRVQERTAALEPRLSTSRHRMAAFIHHGPTHAGLERTAAICEAMGLSFQTPYWDRTLVELCLAVPRDHLLRDGMERVLIRDAMRGRLPEATRTRRSKANFDPLLNVTLRHHAGAETEAMFDAPGRLADWVHLPTLREVASRVANTTEALLVTARSGDAQVLLRALTLWHWQKRIGG